MNNSCRINSRDGTFGAQARVSCIFPLPEGEGTRNGSVGFNIPEQGSRPYTAFSHREIDTWTRVIKTAGIKPQ